MSADRKGIVQILQEFSLPLIVGVLAALAVANLAPHLYERIVEGHWGASLLGHELNLHFVINDVFMVFFFGIATKEIVEACLPGGNLNPIRKAINPLLATMGGVLGPIAVFFAVAHLTHGAGAYPAEVDWATIQRGWGVPTATDIALAWLVARAVFGRGHPAIDFLLLLAVADDAIGLGIIAVFYGDPAHPTRPEFLGLVAAGMALAFTLRKLGVRSWLPYVFLAGPLAWLGLMEAHLHPALALVFIVPFLPGPKRDAGLFVDEEGEVAPEHADRHAHSALHQFEHSMKLFVDLGLFFFAFANAGVEFSVIGPMTWTILASLVVGKTCGITLFSWLGSKLGFPLPTGMGLRQLVMAGYVAALGLTVALFVAGAAFTDKVLLGEAKMGALFTGVIGISAVLIGRALGMSKRRAPHSPAGVEPSGQRSAG